MSEEPSRTSPIWGHSHMGLSPGATEEEHSTSALPSTGTEGVVKPLGAPGVHTSGSTDLWDHGLAPGSSSEVWQDVPFAAVMTLG